MIRKFSNIALRWAVGALLAAYLLAKVDLDQVSSILRSAEPAHLATAFALTLAIRYAHAWQTRLVLAHHGVEETTLHVLGVILITNFYGLLLPGSASSGAIKWCRLSKAGRRAEVLGALLMQRLVNTTIAVLFGVFGFLLDNPFPSAALIEDGSILLLALIFLLGCIFHPALASRLETALLYLLRAGPSILSRQVLTVWHAIAHYRRMPAGPILKIAAVPLIFQTLNLAVFWVTLHGLGLAIPVLALVWLGAMVHLIEFLPFSISGFGFREGALVFFLGYYGVAPPQALTFSLILFAYALGRGLLGGLLELRGYLLLPLARPGKNQ